MQPLDSFRALVRPRPRRRLRCSRRRHGIPERLDPRWQRLADVEALGALPVVPVEAVPIRAVAGPMRRALPARRLAAAHVLLPIDDPVWTDAWWQCPAGLTQSHAQPLH